MSRAAEDLSLVVSTLGYGSEEEMLKELYKMMNLRQMAELTGYSVSTIRSRMLRAKIKMRPRGGPNRTKETM